MVPPPRLLSVVVSIIVTIAAALSLLSGVLVVVSWVRGQSHFVWMSVQPHGIRVQTSHGTALMLSFMVLCVWCGLAIRVVWWFRTAIDDTRKTCPGCGYDLRATPRSCPECGYVPAAPPR